MKFQELNLLPQILKALHEEGYERPTPIQEKSIPVILEGRDLFGAAQTGTGKTAAFSIPILQRLSNDPKTGKGVRCLILAPTRELAIQIGDSIKAYGRHLRLKHTVIFGGVSQNPQVEAIRRGVDILVATPGRLMDLNGQGLLDLRSVEVCVLDEADRMLDMGFIHDVRRIIQLLPERRQNLLFSATLPKEIRELMNKMLHNPAYVEVAPVSSSAETVEQSLCYVNRDSKRDLLHHVLTEGSVQSALVFTRTKHGADKVAKYLTKRGVRAEAIHGNKSQNARQRALGDFKNRSLKVLIATDIASRGIDVEELSHVINYDLPDTPETYVHRIGRTGRAGASGSAISFCSPEDEHLLLDIQKHLKMKLTVNSTQPFHTDMPAVPLPAMSPREKNERYGEREPREMNNTRHTGRKPGQAGSNRHKSGTGKSRGFRSPKAGKVK